MNKSIFPDVLKKREIAPIVNIHMLSSGMTYIYTSKDDERKKENDTSKKIYGSQGFLYSLTVQKIKEMISYLVGNNCEIPDNHYHLSANCRMDDGTYKIISLESAYYTNSGERVYPINNLKNNSYSKKKLNEISSYVIRDTSHYPLYELNIENNGVIDIYVDKKDDIQEFSEEKRPLLEELYFKKDSYPSDINERKNYVKIQANTMKEFCVDLDRLTSAIYKTKEVDTLEQDITFSNLVCSYNKLVFRSVQPQNAIAFNKIFETFPEKINIPTKPEQFELLYARYFNQDMKSMYRFIKSSFSKHSSELLTLNTNLNKYIIEPITQQDGEKITPKQTGRLIKLFKTRSYMEKFLDLKDKEYTKSGIGKNNEFIDFIFRMPSLTGNTGIISDNYVSFMVFPDASVVVRLIKFTDSILNIEKYKTDIELLVKEIRKKIFSILEISKDEKAKFGTDLRPERILTSKMHQELIIPKKLSDVVKTMSSDLAELNLISFPNQQTDTEFKFSYKQVPYFYTNDNKLKFYLQLKEQENSDAGKVRERWMYVAKYYFMMNEIEAVESLRSIIERVTESEKSEKSLDKTTILSRVTINMESYENTKTKLIVHGEEIMHYVAFQEICMLIFVSIMMDKRKASKTELKELELVENEMVDLDILEDPEEEGEFDDYAFFSEGEEEDGPLQDNLAIESGIETDGINNEEAITEEDIQKLLPFNKDATRTSTKIGVFLGKNRVRLDKQLFSYDVTDTHDSYSRVCNTSDGRQPIILTEAQMENFKTKNPVAYKETNFILWGSRENVKNYYVCANIFCFNCNIALTRKQLEDNNFQCSFCEKDAKGKTIKGKIIKRNNITSDATVFVRKSSSNYWRNTLIEKVEKYPDELKGSSVKATPNFIDPKNHPLGLCMPCCAKMSTPKKLDSNGKLPDSIKTFGHFDKCMNEVIQKAVFIEKTKSIPEATSKIEDKIKENKYNNEIVLFYRDSTKKIKGKQLFELLNLYSFDSNGKKTDIVNKSIFTNINLPIQDGLHLQSDNGIFMIRDKSVAPILLEKVSNKKIQFYLQESNKVPIAPNRYGRLKNRENVYFDNKITEKSIYGFEDKSRLFIRYGVEQLKNRSFLSAFLYLYYGNNNIAENRDNFVKLIFENMTLYDFLHLNNGNLARYYCPPFALIKRTMTFDEFTVFNKWCKNPLHKDIIEKLYPSIIDEIVNVKDVKTMNQYLNKIAIKNSRMTMLLRHFYGFQYFLKHLANHNLELPWRTIIHLLSKACIWKNYDTESNIFKNGVNILILETENDKMRLLCPNTVDYTMNYNENKPTLLITKTKDIFEPIVLKIINKVVTGTDSYGNLNNQIIRIFNFNDNRLTQKEKSQIISLLTMISSHCKPLEAETTNIIPKLELNDVLNKAGLDTFKIQIVDFHNRGVGFMITKDSIPFYTQPYEVRPDKEVQFVNEIKPLNLDMLDNKLNDFINNTELVKSKFISKRLQSYYKNIVVDNKFENVIGIVDMFGQFIPIKKLNKDSSIVQKFQKKYGISEIKLDDVNLYSYYLSEQPSLALKNAENEHSQVIRSHDMLKYQVKLMLYNFSRIINSGRNILKNRDTFKTIFSQPQMEARFVLLKDELKKILTNYNTEIAEKKLENHNEDFIKKYPLKKEFLLNLVVIELLSNEFLQREFTTGHIVKPHEDNRDVYIASNDIVSFDDDLKENLQKLFDYVYKPYLLFDFSTDRRINDGQIKAVEIINKLPKKSLLTIRKKDTIYAVDTDKYGQKLPKHFNMKSGKCIFPFKHRVKDGNKDNFDDIYSCIPEHPKDINNKQRGKRSGLKGATFCATELYGIKSRGARNRAKSWGRCVTKEEYLEHKKNSSVESEPEPEKDKDKEDKDNKPKDKEPEPKPESKPKPTPKKDKTPPKKTKKKDNNAVTKKKTAKTLTLASGELPENPPGWRGPFMNTVFIDSSKEAGVCKGMANSKRMNTIQEALEYTSTKERFDKAFKTKDGKPNCDYDNVRAIVKTSKGQFSIRGVKSGDSQKFNETKLKKPLKSSKNETTYIKEEYYESL